MAHEFRRKFPWKNLTRSTKFSVRARIQNHCVREIIRKAGERSRTAYRHGFGESNSRLDQPPTKLRRFRAMQLQRVDKRESTNPARILPIRIGEDRDFAYFYRQLCDPIFGSANVYVTFTLRHKIKAQRIGTGFHRNASVRFVRDSANLNEKAIPRFGRVAEHS